MSSETETSSRFGFVRSYPGDLVLGSAATICCWYAVSSLPAGSRLRIAFALPLLFALPGYATIAILFPGAPGTASQTSERLLRIQGIDLAERLALSFATSLSLLPVIAGGIVLIGLDLEPSTATNVLGALTIAAMQLGAWRRLQRPREKRFTVHPRREFDRLVGTERRSNTWSALLLIAAFGLAAGVLLFALASPPAAASYTEIAVYGENENGTYEIGAVPAAIEPNASVPLSVEVTNNHDEDRTYTAVIQEQSVDDGTVLERTTLAELEYDLERGTSTQAERAIQPTAALNETVRIVILLYETDDGAVPVEPTMDNADKALYFWMTVTEDPDDDGTIIVD